MKQKLLIVFFILLIFVIKSYGQVITVDCSMPPLTIDYCYDNENTAVFTYVSSNGLPLTLTINSGEVEDGWDELLILDSDGVVNLNGAPYGNEGDISGMTFESSGDSITFFLMSDATGSCASGSFPDGINYTVSCYGCDLEIDLGPDQTLCSGETVILNAESYFGDFYEWYKDGTVIPDENESTLAVTESGDYGVVVSSQSCSTDALDETVITFVDCENAGLIHVDAFYDANENSFFDTDENYFSNGYFTYEINNDGIINTVYASDSFTLASFEETDTYVFVYHFYDEYQDCYDVSNNTFDDVSVANGSEINIDFAVVDDQSCEDIAVYLIGNAPPRPGFNHTNYLSIENLGLVSASGSIDFLLDSNLVFDSVNPNANYTVTTTSYGFTLDFVNLQPGFSINATVFLFCPTTVALGEMVTNTAILTTTSNDIVAENNTSSITETVIGSYDPNDITESHGPQIVYDDFVASDEYLYYLIRFQNIGTAEAIHVRIENVLNSQLDEGTFRMLHSSHDNVVTKTGNQLIWQFDNINLPSESMDAEGSNGFVYFKIKPQAGYGIGDIIPNVADIYFDFNEAITTNTFNTEFVQTLSVNDYDATMFSIYPNPANDLINIHMNGSFLGTFNVEVFDVQGKSVLSKIGANESTMQLNVSSLESGLYFIKMKTESNETIKKLIVN